MPKIIPIHTQNLCKVYRVADNHVKALNAVNLTIQHNEFVSITGSSGSGKSTLMHIIGCLDAPTSGHYFLDGVNVAELDKNSLATIRNKKIGFIFQRFHLLANLTATDNVALPLLYARVKEKDAQQQARRYLELVNLEARLDHYAHQLSGGQQQRVAIARSLVNQPSIILADEPTGNLDTDTGDEIMRLFKKLHKENEVTIIIVTHEPKIAVQTQRTIKLVDGVVTKDKNQS